jgi:hypothetical protein
MITSKIRILTIFLLFFIITLSLIPVVQAKPRKTYITDFLYECEIKDEGFSNSVENDDDVSEDATAYALEILDQFDLLQKKDIFGTVEHEVNTTDLPEELEDDAKGMFEIGNVDIYNLYFLLKSLMILEDNNDDYDISSSLENDAISYLDSLLHNEGGYVPSSTSTSATIASTYFALRIYDLLDEDFENETITKNWVRACQNSDGGYGGNIGLTSNIMDTYYAISIMDIIEDVDALNNEDKTIDYLESFYEDNENNLENYGGYYPDEDTETTLISSTYFCVMGIYLIDEDEIDHEEETLTWILNRQNFKDGGFADNDDESKQKYSSVINSFYAVQLIKLYDADLISLNEEIFMVEFNWWILVGILIGIGLIAIAVIIIRRKRRI